MNSGAPMNIWSADAHLSIDALLVRRCTSDPPMASDALEDMSLEQRH
jgi:hypothetical protein